MMCVYIWHTVGPSGFVAVVYLALLLGMRLAGDVVIMAVAVRQHAACVGRCKA
jgi:hypothetical protein